MCIIAASTSERATDGSGLLIRNAFQNHIEHNCSSVDALLRDFEALSCAIIQFKSRTGTATNGAQHTDSSCLFIPSIELMLSMCAFSLNRLIHSSPRGASDRWKF